MANKYNSNRLQFVHCETLFATREDAKAYLEGQLISIDRPALYAEPMILKYGDSMNPNILLAIGSVGDGVSRSTNNKVFYIDLADVHESMENILDIVEVMGGDVEEAREKIQNIIAACGFNEDGDFVANDDDIIKAAKTLKEVDHLLAQEIAKNKVTVKDTTSVDLSLDVQSSGTTISADVILAESKIVDGKVLPNILLSEQNGIFTNVEVSYADDVITVSVNGDIKTYQLPHEVHLIKGEYNIETECFDLTLSDDTVVSISASKLIDEWGVLDVASQDSPIVLTKEHVGHEVNIHGVTSYRDILSADVRVATKEEEEYNILQKDATNNRYLYVDGTAKNITYFKNGVPTTVQDAIDNIKCESSSHAGNIVSVKADGVFATVDVTYDASKNILTFDNGINGGKEIVLNSAQIIEDIYYDVTDREIVIKCSLTDGTKQEVRIKVDDVLTTFDVDNTNKTVTLSNTTKDSKTYISADVNISNIDDNILVNDNNSLYVKGSADNIKYDDKNTVYSMLFKLDGTVDTIGSVRNLINAEKTERVASDEALAASVTLEKSERKTADTELQAAINSEAKTRLAETTANATAITTEVIERSNADIALQTAINEAEVKLNTKIDTTEDALSAKINADKNELNGAITKVKSDLTSEIKALDVKADTLSATVTTDIANQVKTLETTIATEVDTFNNEVNRVVETLTSEIEKVATSAATANDKTNSDLSTAIATETASRIASDESITNELLHVRTVAANATNKLDAETLRINTLYEDKVKQDADIQQNKADIVELQGEMATKAHAWSTLETASVKPTLQDNILSADVKVDPSTANIIKVNTNGIIAQVTLSYDQTTNTLTFNNGMARDSWKLMNNSLIEDAYYNKSGELILVIKNANGSTEEIKVQLDRMIGGTKDGSPIIVNINTDEATGSRVVTADLNISTDDRNLLSSSGALFASKMASDHYGTYNEEEHTMQEILGMIKEDIRLASNAPLESRVITLEAKVLALETAISQLIDFGTYEADDNEEATE